VIAPDAISYDVLRALAPECSSYFCIGVQEGHCLANVLIGNPKIESLTLCDTWGPVHGGTDRGDHAHIDSMLTNMGYRGEVTYFDCDSKRLPLGLPTFDLAYIDGDHSYDYALHDMNLVWPHVTKHMVVHDIAFTDVARALRHFLKALPVAAAVTTYTGGTHTAVVSR